MATYPYTQVTLLVNSIQATTVVAIVSGMQVSTTTFSSPGGDLGSVTLSPVQPTATNVQFQVGLQTLQLDTMTFRAQFGLDSGQVTASGRATDQMGQNETAFSKQKAAWS